MSEFGGLIRDAREKLGMSPHRVAELIGRASGTVKAWERGRTVPSDPFVVSSLAAVLAIDEETLFHAANLNPPDRQQPLTIEQELATIAPSRPAASASSTPTSDRPAIVADPPEQSPSPDVAEYQHEPDSSTTSVTDFVQKGVDAITEVGTPLLEKLRSRRPRTPRRESTSANRASVPVSQPVVPTGSYLDDPEERWSYRLRALWTAAGVGALGVLLLWAGSRALEAFGETWDALLAGL